MPRVMQEQLFEVIRDGLVNHGVNEEVANETAELLTQNSMDGVASHGANRYPRIISYLKQGYIKPDNKPECVRSFGAIEQWDGNLGMGPTNAKRAMERAVALAKEYGIGCVAMRNTNHWMRAGSYGLQAAQAGCIGICWTNTIPNMPAWGAKDCRVGNNPLVMCIPKEEGHVLIDAAMAQFSYGAIEKARLAGKQLPVPGGYNEQGELTTDPAEIEKTWRVLPMGFWKGPGYALALDLIAACLSDGRTSRRIGQAKDEYGLSQVFIAIDMKNISANADELIEEAVQYLKQSERIDENTEVLYPGERSWRTRQENLEKGIPVDDGVWEQLLALRDGPQNG